ncbi:MAG: RraA family protein [Negativicutes bacterium]|nr:RraA family protein [Negativicutes bacterium]
MPILTESQLEELRNFDSPTIANAIERFKIRPFTEGFMGPEIKCILPCEKPVVGYACTAKVSALKPPTPKQIELWMAYYEKIKETPFPTISVIEDTDQRPIGAFWGEVQASIHKALGCVGVATNGGVRDLDEADKLGFKYFASCILVSHAYIHVEEVDCTVNVGGLTVRPGDLLHADKHGVVLIPQEIAPQLAEACRMAQWAEEPVIRGCREKFATGATIEEIRAWRQEMASRRTEK